MRFNNNGSDESDKPQLAQLSPHEMSFSVSTSVQIELIKDGLCSLNSSDKNVIFNAEKMWAAPLVQVCLNTVCRHFIIGENFLTNSNNYMETCFCS